MDTPLDVTLPPASLLQLCTVKITVSMLNAFLEYRSANRVFSFYQALALEEIISHLLGNVERIGFPDPLKPYLRSYLIFALSEMRFWYKVDLHPSVYHIAGDWPLTNEVLRKVAWTVQCRVDRKQTARNFLTTNLLGWDTNLRFRLACTFHQEDLIRQLWSEMEPERQVSNMNRNGPHVFYAVLYWAYELMGVSEEFLPYMKNRLDFDDGFFSRVENDSSLRPRYVYALLHYLKMEDLRAARFFGGMCNEREKMLVIETLGSDFCDANMHKETTLFYYSMMNRAYLENLLKTEPVNIHQLFYSLSSEVLVSVFRKLKSVISHQGFLFVLQAIARNEGEGYGECLSPLDLNWGPVFRDIWLHEVDESYRSYVLNLSGHEKNTLLNLLQTLNNFKHYESIKLILRFLSQSQRRTLFSDFIQQRNSYHFEFNLQILDRFSDLLLTSVDDLNYVKALPFEANEGRQKVNWEKILLKMESSVSRKRKAQDSD